MKFGKHTIAVRAVDGHSERFGADVKNIYRKVDKDFMKAFPICAYQTYWRHLPNIMLHGLWPGDRAGPMMTNFPP